MTGVTEQTMETEPAAASPAAKTGVAGRLDGWLAAHPWHPRVVPEFAYLLLMSVTIFARDHLAGWMLIPLYVVQCGVTAWLLWKWRGRLPELNWRFHWSALPVGLGVCAAWVALGLGTIHLFPSMGPTEAQRAGEEPVGFAAYFPEDAYGAAAPVLTWVALGLRLLGMSLVVPMFEELFNRSLLLRSLSHPRLTAIGVVNLVHDMPLIDEVFGDTDLARRAGKHHRVFGDRFEAVPLGKLTVFGVLASTLVFMVVHAPADYAGAFVCGVVYCLLVGYTNNSRRRLGLGPVIWAHAITNAALWAWVVYVDEPWGWHFMS